MLWKLHGGGRTTVEKKRLLTKSAFLCGLQCDKLLWVDRNQPEQLPPVDESTQAVFDQGHQVGDLAKELYPDGIEIDWENGHEAGIAQTRAVLAERKPMFEAGFQTGKLHARADILQPAAGGRWDLIEAKSSSKVKEEHIPDVAFQKHVYESAGIRIRRCYLIHIDTSYTRRGALDVEGLFQRTEVTGEVGTMEVEVRSEARRLLSVMAKPRCPEVEVGPHCAGCALYDQCWSFLPDHSVFSLARGGAKSYDLMEQGILKVRDIPEDFELNAKQEIQVACDKSGKVHIERNALRRFLDQLRYPLYFLDFETMSVAVPPYDLLSPYEKVPFQYSLHIVDSPVKRARRHSYIAGGAADPRPEILSNLKTLIGKKGSIVAFNASFEKSVLRSCVNRFPRFAAWFQSMEPRIVDLYTPFRDFHYYHPDQDGSASLKAVLPVLTGKSYEDLEIADGQVAALRFREMAFGNLPAAKEKEIRNALEIYCRQDSEGMLEIVKALEKLC